MRYTGISLRDEITIDLIYTIHYFEYMNNFYFEGESHNFWEFLCVDKGEVQITVNDTPFLLKKGEIAFHKPNEFHSVSAAGTVPPNLVVISFQCNSTSMKFFEDKLLKIDDVERNFLANIILEAKNCFEGRLDDPYLTKMKYRSNSSFASEQLIRLHLELFIIHLIRRYRQEITSKQRRLKPISKSTKSKSDSELFNRVSDYLHARLSQQITIEQICRDNLIGRSQLQKIFNDKCGLGIIEYFSSIKVDAAKEMIRTNQYNFTQIAEKLGYSSIHYFSRQFKKITNMTPSEYASSIKAMAEGSF